MSLCGTSVHITLSVTPGVQLSKHADVSSDKILHDGSRTLLVFKFMKVNNFSDSLYLLVSYNDSSYEELYRSALCEVGRE